MIYEYKCRVCGDRMLTTTRGDTMGRCRNTGCNGELRRVFSVNTMNVHPSTRFKPQAKNIATGLPTNSMREHEDNLRRLSEERTRATGIEHNYVSVDPRDRDAAGVSKDAEDHLKRNRAQAKADKIAQLKKAA